MNVLPDEIPVVDAKLKQLRVLKRQAGSSDRYSEADFDELIVNQASSISSLLNNAGVLQGTELRFIARQVANIDVLFGEVEGDELVRLVFVEDKLFKNPDSGRKVLAQILEYANKDVSAEEILERAAPNVREWLTPHREALERLLAEANFLLMICGDRINPRLLEIAKPMLDRRTLALRGVELVLLSLALYEDAGTAVVIPNLVGAVKGFERDLRIEVTVQTDKGLALPATVELEERASEGLRAVPRRRQSQPWTEERFLERVRTNAKESGWGGGDWAGALVAILRRCEATPGLVVRWAPSSNKNGYFNVEVVRPDGDVKVFWATEGCAFGVWTRAIEGTLGVELAGRRAEELAQRLNVPLSGASNEDPELGDDDRSPTFHNQKDRDVLFDWIIRMRDELLAARKQ